ncbi:aldo/keto reductase family oxidoreductase [Acidovorax sp. GBBC 3334]|uniref:aldo/keto reductase family oxidoreductase n=1 Tax=Acidovorax sp. GBBC 3334 TaxID=2940496 RepID=UPI0023024841|nr:aldo/keto reductase family oxidoreductase [Acidovorax sp. GBBC 3334]MDA8453816.1 aldo/keto reductase family oxidoreductase [Acidovorax sp. GBBC 3334]
MDNLEHAGVFPLGDRQVNRIGYGTMQLAGPGVFGPPRDRQAALAVLRTAVERGVNHIDTADFYGPHATNQIVREALGPYAGDLTIATKVGVGRDGQGAWLKADAPDELRQAVHDNLRNLGLEVLDIVNFRVMLDAMAPREGSIEEPLATLAALQKEGLIRHIGLSNVTPAQLAQARRICKVACVQNHYNLVHRADDAMVDLLAQEGIPYVPFFPLGGFTPLQSTALSEIALRLEATPLQVALAWLLRRSPNLLLIPGTSSVTHLQQNLAAAHVELPADAMSALEGIPAGSAPPPAAH